MSITTGGYVMARRKASRRPKGLGEIESLPNGRFRARLTRTAGGKRSRGGSKTFPTRKEAQDWLDRHKKHGPGLADSIARVLKDWLVVHKANVAPMTYRHDAQKVRRWLVPRLGTIRLRDLDSDRVKLMLAEMKDDGASDSERHKAGSVLRKALNSLDPKKLPDNPMLRVRLPSPKTPEKRVMSLDQSRDLCRAADVLRCGYWVRLWLDAGLRPGELLGLHWEDIDLKKGLVKVDRSLDSHTHRTKDPKTEKSRRTVPLGRVTVEAIRAVAGEGVFLPDSRGGYWWESNFREDLFKPLVRAAGLGWVTPYTLRHTSASLLLSAGVNVVIVSRRLGHDNIITTMKSYAHLMPDDQERAAEVMDRLFGGGPGVWPGPTPQDGPKVVRAA